MFKKAKPGAQGGPQGGGGPRRARRAIGSPASRAAINLAVTLVVGAAYFYLSLPALNQHSESFYGLLRVMCLAYILCAVLTSGFQGTGVRGYFSF